MCAGIGGGCCGRPGVRYMGAPGKPGGGAGPRTLTMPPATTKYESGTASGYRNIMDANRGGLCAKSTLA